MAEAHLFLILTELRNYEKKGLPRGGALSKHQMRPRVCLIITKSIEICKKKKKEIEIYSQTAEVIIHQINQYIDK